MAQPERLVPLGVVARPHGVSGELRVHRFNASSTLLLERDAVWLRRGEDVREHRVESARLHSGFVLLRLRGVEGRDAADLLRGVEVCVPRDALPPPDPDEVYLADLVGLQARLADGSVAGEIVDVISYPSADCLLLRTGEGDREVPLLKPYVRDVDLTARTVIVEHLEDLELLRSSK